MTNSEQVLNNLRSKCEGDEVNGFALVYLDNARNGMNDKVFRAALAQLSKDGLYEVEDGYAWGWVKVK